MWYLWIVLSVVLAALIAAIWLRGTVPRGDARRLKRIERLYRVGARLLPNIPEMSTAELLERRQDGRLAIVDVRKPQELAVSRIPGALSQAEFESRKAEFRGVPVVAYCTLGFRSGRYVAALCAEGFDAWNLRGAILAWTHAQQPLVDAQGETRRVHVYSRAMDLVAEGYEAVW